MRHWGMHLWFYKQLYRSTFMKKDKLAEPYDHYNSSVEEMS